MAIYYHFNCKNNVKESFNLENVEYFQLDKNKITFKFKSGSVASHSYNNEESTKEVYEDIKRVIDDYNGVDLENENEDEIKLNDLDCLGRYDELLDLLNSKNETIKELKKIIEDSKNSGIINKVNNIFKNKNGK